MNNTTYPTINYPYLAGALEAVIKNLAYDYAFSKIDKNDVNAQTAHLEKLVNECRKSAEEFGSKYGSA